MHIIEITALDNGAHKNQNGTLNAVPDGWALIPDTIEIPGTYPFVDITVEEINGVQTVTSMTAGTVPEKTEEEEDPSTQNTVSSTDILETVIDHETRLIELEFAALTS